MLRYSKETCWVWTLQLGSASTNSALILWKKDCHSQTHVEKQFGCLGKHFGCWFSLHYCQFLSPAWDFPKETLSLDLLTRSSAHRFIMCSRARPLTMQRSTSWHHYLRGNVQFVKSEFFNFGTLQGNTEKAMATHSSILAWKIPWTEDTGRLQSMGSQRVGRDWATNTFMYIYTGVNRFSFFPISSSYVTTTECYCSAVYLYFILSSCGLHLILWGKRWKVSENPK